MQWELPGLGDEVEPGNVRGRKQRRLIGLAGVLGRMRILDRLRHMVAEFYARPLDRAARLFPLSASPLRVIHLNRSGRDLLDESRGLINERLLPAAERVGEPLRAVLLRPIGRPGEGKRSSLSAREGLGQSFQRLLANGLRINFHSRVAEGIGDRAIGRRSWLFRAIKEGLKSARTETEIGPRRARARRGDEVIITDADKFVSLDFGE